MAVNIENTTTAQQQAQKASANKQRNNNRANSTSFKPNLGFSSRMNAFGTGGESYEKLYTIIKDKIENISKTENMAEKLAVIKLLKGAHGLNYSGIIITETLDNVTAAHVLMIEKTGDYPDAIVEYHGQQKYELLRTPADALDRTYVEAVINQVRDTLGVTEVVLADGTLVPNEFDVGNEFQVDELLGNTFNSVHAEIMMHVHGYKGLNITELIQSNPNGKFLINTYYNGSDEQYYDQTGMPVRQDICVSLKYKTNQGNRGRSVNQGEDTHELVRTYGYMDFEWAGTSPGFNNFGQPNTQVFVPNFVITHIEASQAPTPDMIMLAVNSVIALKEDMSWMQSFKSTTVKKGEIDFNDIGALNIEGNTEMSPTRFGKLYDTKSKDFTPMELNTYTQMLVRPGMSISMDLPKAGPETWYTSFLKAIRLDGSESAYRRLMDSVTTLTNGKFVNSSPVIFSPTTNKIHGGFFKGKNGLEDIRKISSYLSMANFVAATGKNPESLAHYTNTLYSNSIQTENRAMERLQMIQEIANGTAVVKQFYDRVTFNGDFIGTVSGALGAAGFAPVHENMGNSNEMFMRRSSLDLTGAIIGEDVRIMGQQNNAFGGFGWTSSYNRGF